MRTIEMKRLPDTAAKTRAHRIAVKERLIERMVKAGNWQGVTRAADEICDLRKGVKDLRIFVNRKPRQRVKTGSDVA